MPGAEQGRGRWLGLVRRCLLDVSTCSTTSIVLEGVMLQFRPAEGGVEACLVQSVTAGFAVAVAACRKLLGKCLS
jgi:hypothetical protein